MMQAILTRFPWTWMPVFALMIFFSFFVILLIRLSLKSRQPIFTAAASLPLEEGVRHESR